ncbi:cytochrome b5 domain-containing protein 1 [Anopheles arabiensis]|uniref:cytochrome b5 domain-containing protein 1 n=1 Tax=Anopheles arabiensis TaxID=7173 RepID=UPI001AAD29DF|nr:cytochrome b5 domain-containing protein 1 [Anopheles arabiensis]
MDIDRSNQCRTVTGWRCILLILLKSYMKKMESKLQPPLKYFLRDEVVIHNEATSAWVIVHGTVIDITPLFAAAERKTSLQKKTLQWLLALAGQDLSSFFHNNELTPIERTNRNGERVPIFVPCLERNPATQLYWYRDPALVIGRITFHPCPVKIINTLTFHETEMIVCYEDTIGDVREKYLRYNDNACRYEWRKDLSMGSETGLLRMDKTLTENGYQVNLRSPIPVIWIFYILPPGTIDTTNGTHSCSGTSCNTVNGPQAEESQNASASPDGKQSINATTKTNCTALDIHECAKN